MSELNLTVLIENSAPDALIPEHGLAVHLDYKGRSLLLDAGQTGAALVNAERLGVDLSTVTEAFLSHGHFDHADGLDVFFALNKTAPVFARTHVVDECYSGERYIGVNPLLFKRYPARFDLSDQPRQIGEGVWVIPDAVDHEQSLVLETEGGLVILNSCCHAGADHVVESVLDYLPGRKVRALIGGFHLMGKGGVTTLGPAPEEVVALGHRLFHELGVEQVWTGHCTGDPAFELLKNNYPEYVSALISGLKLSF